MSMCVCIQVQKCVSSRSTKHSCLLCILYRVCLNIHLVCNFLCVFHVDNYSGKLDASLFPHGEGEGSDLAKVTFNYCACLGYPFNHLLTALLANHNLHIV